MDGKILIIGASGIVGKEIYNYFKEKGEEVIGTYCSKSFDEGVYFDIVSSSLDDLDLRSVKYCIICSAMAKIDECKKDSEKSRLVNVESVKRLVEVLVLRDIFPVFISGSAVFSGSGNYKENDFRKPANLYGLQKKEVEDFLVYGFKDYLIVRLCKVFGIDDGVFKEWLEKYKNGEDILCASDEVLSLVYSRDVARAIWVLMNFDKKGVYHIDSGIHKNRYQFAKEFFEFLDFSDVKLRKCSIDDFKFLDGRDKNAYMDNSKFVSETGFEFSDMKEVWEKMI